MTNLASLVVGLVGGYALQFLAARRTRREQRTLTDVATLERCVEVFNARVEYIIAYHTRPASVRNQRKSEYDALYYGNLHALPEAYVEPATWEIWMVAERDARDQATPMSERLRQVKDARLAVLGWLTDRRNQLLGNSGNPT